MEDGACCSGGPVDVVLFGDEEVVWYLSQEREVGCNVVVDEFEVLLLFFSQVG